MTQVGMMEGKVVVVTGAGRGIGAAIAKLMAKEGAKVVVNDIGVSLAGEGGDEAPAHEVVAEIKEVGGEAIANSDSVAEFASAGKIIQCAVDTYGRIDCVVNNAGILRDVIFHKMSEDDWDSVVNVMLKGAFNTCRHAADHFRKQESGSFVQMTSTAGLIGAMGQVNYGAAKLGLVGLSKNISIDMQRFNVRSNCIAPVAWTRMTASIPPSDPAAAKRIEQRKQVTPEQRTARSVPRQRCGQGRDRPGVLGAQERDLSHEPVAAAARHSSAEGWTPQTCAEHMLPALKSWFFPLDRTADVFPWDSI